MKVYQGIMETECPICIETFNKSQRTQVQCTFCDYVACKQCIKRYLLDSTLEASCLNCKVGWDPEYIRTIMPKSFLANEYKKFRENMLLSLEESLLPETQAYANFQNEMDKEWDELVQLRNLIRTLKDDYNMKYNQYYRKYNRGYRAVNEKRQFIMKCPDNECRGFLSTQYKCGQCSKNYCKDCYELKMDGHMCNPDDVKTVELLHTNTKRCPSCSISIFKIDGCNQMWCVECKTAFSWDTGRIINGVIHNPHYFEWQQRQNQRGQHEMENENGNACPNERITPSIRRFRFLDLAQQQRITNLIQVITHVREVTIPSLTENEDRFTRNRDIRVDYLNGHVTRDYFKWLVQKRDKASQKKRLMVMLWQMFIMSYNDLLNNLLIMKDFSQFEQQNKELLTYINSEFRRIGKLFTTRIRILNNQWNLVYA